MEKFLLEFKRYGGWGTD